jgi:Helix-turn-helix
VHASTTPFEHGQRAIAQRSGSPPRWQRASRWKYWARRDQLARSEKPRWEAATLPAMTRHRLNPVRLRAEILKRGLDGQTFAVEAGISAATLSHVVSGRSANPRTLTAIVRALARIPPVEGFEELLEELPQADIAGSVTGTDQRADNHRGGSRPHIVPAGPTRRGPGIQQSR